jgi:hypothetical protein
MAPDQLQPEQFRFYPPLARQLATTYITLLRCLPLSFVPLLLREVILYDWMFPPERRGIDQQFAYLSGLSSQQLAQTMARFAQLRISPELEKMDWVASPSRFSEQLSVYLWASQQMDAFRAAAIKYVQEHTQARTQESIAIHPLGIVIIGQGVTDNNYPLFRKLRPYGMYYSHVHHENGRGMLVDVVAKRAAAHPVPYGHWYIEGGSIEKSPPAVVCVSCSALTPVRVALQNQMKQAIDSGAGPEAVSSILAQTEPEEVGLSGSGERAVLDRFQLSLFTEGSGTQIYTTTFVQWTAREVLRRAQPLTLLVHFTPRQKERPMNELLSETRYTPALDPAGSLVDADMGAYYTWVNQQRLEGAAQSSFFVWFEDHGEVLVVSPSLGRGLKSDVPVDLRDLLDRI